MTAPDLSPVYATLHFYYDDPDSMKRMQVCLEAQDVLCAIEDFERWLRNTIDSGWREVPLESVRDRLFSCFLDNGVTIPGWE